MERFLIRKPVTVPAESQSVRNDRTIEISSVVDPLLLCPVPKKATKAVIVHVSLNRRVPYITCQTISNVVEMLNCDVVM